jgi:hypothetical protein
MPWPPTRIEAQLDAALTTSTAAVRVRTDAGEAFCKAVGGPDEPPSALACDWIGSRLGQLLGLPVPAVAMCQADLPLVLSDTGLTSIPGSAFLSQVVPDAETWDGEAASLGQVENPEVIAGGVLLDTWILNHDRYGYRRDGQRRANVRNILLQTVGTVRRRRTRLVWLIDHTHCLTRRDGGGFAAKIDAIDHIQDDRLLGLFPAFVGFATSAHAGPWIERLRSIAEADIRTILTAIPPAWEVESAQRTTLLNLLLRRRDYLLDHWLPAMAAACAWASPPTDNNDHEET